MVNKQSSQPSVLDVVALPADLPADGLARGQVGTVVELLEKEAALVEFNDDDGRAYLVVRCPTGDLRACTTSLR